MRGLIVGLVLATALSSASAATLLDGALKKNYTPVPHTIHIQSQCGPVNCCLNAQCRYRYASQRDAQTGKCQACAVQ